MAYALPRMQLRRGFDLGAKVGRGAQQEPHDAILGDRELRLRARFSVKCAGSHGATIVASTVPLWKRASGRRTKNPYLHLL